MRNITTFFWICHHVWQQKQSKFATWPLQTFSKLQCLRKQFFFLKLPWCVQHFLFFFHVSMIFQILYTNNTLCLDAQLHFCHVTIPFFSLQIAMFYKTKTFKHCHVTVTNFLNRHDFRKLNCVNLPCNFFTNFSNMAFINQNKISIFVTWPILTFCKIFHA